MNYWENETPVKATTRRNEIEYYKAAGKLAISRPAWTDDSGNTRRGKTVTLDLAALREAPEAVAIFKEITVALCDRQKAAGHVEGMEVVNNAAEK